MSSVRFLVGDVFERMAELPDCSFDLILTSPPFLALRCGRIGMFMEEVES